MAGCWRAERFLGLSDGVAVVAARRAGRRGWGLRSIALRYAAFVGEARRTTREGRVLPSRRAETPISLRRKLCCARRSIRSLPTIRFYRKLATDEGSADSRELSAVCVKGRAQTHLTAPLRTGQSTSRPPGWGTDEARFAVMKGRVDMAGRQDGQALLRVHGYKRMRWSGESAGQPTRGRHR